MNICIVCGARPNFIKVAPVIRVLDKEKASGRAVDYRLVYTGLESDIDVEDNLFDDLGIHRPDVYLHAASPQLNVFTGEVMQAFDGYLRHHPTDVVIVVDDLASAMAASIVAKRQGLRLAHLTAGTRSFDITMPKEVNRLVIDGLSDLLFTAGQSGSAIAGREGVEQSKVYMVGNLLVDNLRYQRERIARPAVMDDLGLQENNYFVLTLNRKELLHGQDASGNRLWPLLDAMSQELRDSHLPVVAALRKDATNAVVAHMMHSDDGVGQGVFRFVAPQNYLDFAYLTAHARGIITDSGNVADEATFNQVPCVTLNGYTEHEETVSVGTNMLIGEDADTLRQALRKLVAGDWKKSAIPDRWDGRSAERIVQIILEQ